MPGRKMEMVQWKITQPLPQEALWFKQQNGRKSWSGVHYAVQRGNIGSLNDSFLSLILGKMILYEQTFFKNLSKVGNLDTKKPFF